jgi:N-acyl-L-homoserine lactone synthetase
MVTEIQRTAEGKRVTILSFAGTNVDDQRVMFSSIKNWAAKNGASRIRAICKDPQTRLFARDGFVKIANVIELELDHDE